MWRKKQTSRSRADVLADAIESNRDYVLKRIAELQRSVFGEKGYNEHFSKTIDRRLEDLSDNVNSLGKDIEIIADYLGVEFRQQESRYLKEKESKDVA